jgi:hypothetical protein
VTVRLTGIGLVMAVVVAVAGSILVPGGAASAAEVNPEWGSVSAKGGKLKKSCRNYRYSYEVTPPAAGDWDLGVSVVGPDGKVAWFGYLWEGAFPASGTERFRLCRSQAKPGRYKLRAVVSNQYFNEVETYRLPVARFRLR